MQNTIVSSSHGTSDDAVEYEVISEDCELPLGSSFIVLPGQVEFGVLALFTVGDLLIIGGWAPDLDGVDSILQLRRRIRITGQVPFRIVGAVVLCPEAQTGQAGAIKPWSTPESLN